MKTALTRWMVFGAVALSVTGAPASLRAQEADDYSSARPQVTREALEQLLTRLEQTQASNAYSDELRKHARAEAELVRARLTEGDFRVGDRVELKVDRQPELTNTFTVTEGPALVLPGVGELKLAGVLRAEFEDRLKAHLAKYLVDPLIEADPLIRIWIDGAVNQPGFFTISAGTPLVDAVMKAGGPAKGAQLTSMRIERGETRIWEGEGLQQAITEGRTLDQMNLQAGDRLVFDDPASTGGNATSKLANFKRAIWIIPSAIFMISRLTRRF